MIGHRKFLVISVLVISGAVYAADPVVNTAAPAKSYFSWEVVKVKVKTWLAAWGVVAPPVEAAPSTAVATEPNKSAPAIIGGGSATPMAMPVYQIPASSGATPVSASQSTAAAPVKAPVVVPVSREAQELRSQPLFSQKSAGTSLEELQSAKAALKGRNLIGIKKAARAGSTQMPRTRAGVPVYDLKKMKVGKKIPRLDIGTEALISKEDFALPKMSWGLQQPNSLKPLPKVALVSESEIQKAKGQPVTVAKGPRGLQGNFRNVEKVVTLEKVQKIQYQITEPTKTELRAYKPLSDEEIKLVSALILFERGDHCHMVMGLFGQLAQAPKTKIEATYHLGACADQLNMQQAAFDQLAQVVKTEDKEFAPMALELLAKDLPTIYEKEFYTLVKGLKNFKAIVTEKSSDDVFYRYAKGANKSGDFKTALTMAEMVQKSFKDEAQYLAGISYFAMKDKKNAVRKLEELWTSLETRGVSDSNIRSVTATNLARIYFGQKNYTRALELYNKVPKDHAYWVQALIEQGWTQLALSDSAGAIGNMYSLHSPYFKSVYQPESFVVRTIGYLNICQYGDAYKTLSFLENDYRNWHNKTSAYMSSHANDGALYETVKTYLRGKSSDDVEGIPYQVLREMARRKEFLNAQVALNDKQDEFGRYEGVNTKIKKQKATIRTNAEAAKKRFDSYNARLAAAKKSGLTRDFVEINAGLKRERDLTVGYRYQLTLLELSRQGYLAFQSNSQGKLTLVKNELVASAGKILTSRAKVMQSEMAKVLENNEFLRYEIFAGSGENIRYQVAGGAVDGTNNRIPANIKPTKMMNWSFDGEFWEDEIGSYRSALHNNCPVDAHQSQALLGKEDEE